MALPVSCFLFGAQKSGTTSLADLLAKQESICLASPKEPHYFSKHFDKSITWYEGLYRDPSKPVLLDASPDYSRGPTELFTLENNPFTKPFKDVPSRLFAYNPDAKLIYIMRNPVNRTYSSYWHNIRAGTESLDFSKSIRESGRYLVASDYYGQLLNYLEYFDIGQFHFVLFEDFVMNPNEAVRRCCEFLNIEYLPIDPDNGTHKNASYQLNAVGKKVRLLTGSQQNYKLLSRVISIIIPQSTKEELKRVFTSEIPKITSNDALYLENIFAERNKKMAELTGLDISQWQ